MEFQFFRMILLHFQNNEYINLEFEKESKSLKIANKLKSTKLVSVGGNVNSKRWSNIEIDNDVMSMVNTIVASTL